MKDGHVVVWRCACYGMEVHVHLSGSTRAAEWRYTCCSVHVQLGVLSAALDKVSMCGKVVGEVVHTEFCSLMIACHKTCLLFNSSLHLAVGIIATATTAFVVCRCSVHARKGRVYLHVQNMHMFALIYTCFKRSEPMPYTSRVHIVQWCR